MAEVGNALEDIDEPYLKNITNDAYIGLLVHLAVAVERISQGKFVTEESYDASLDKGYDIAKKIAVTLEKGSPTLHSLNALLQEPATLDQPKVVCLPI